MDIGSNQKRNRLIALSFASVLLLLVYGPLAPWFLTADRFLYDTFSSGLPNRPLDNAIIISIDPSRVSQDELLGKYGQVLSVLTRSQARRIILPQPPQLGADDRLPGWSAALGGPVPVYVLNSHRLAELTSHTGFMEFAPDNDGVLRRTGLWQLNGTMMLPSLALAVALDNHDLPVSRRMSASDDSVYLSNYEGLPRVAVD